MRSFVDDYILGFSLFCLMNLKTSLHWGTSTLEDIFIRDVLA